MGLRLVLIVVMLVGVAGLGLLGVIAMAPTPQAPRQVTAEAPPERVSVLVAARAVQAGTLLKPEDVTARETLVADLPEGAMRDAPETRIEFIGAMVRRTLSQGDVLRFDGVLRPGENGFLAAVLAPGHAGGHRRRRCRLRHRRADLARRPRRRHPDPGLRRARRRPRPPRGRARRC